MPMNDVLKTLASEQQKAEVPEVRPGDTVAVSVRVVDCPVSSAAEKDAGEVQLGCAAMVEVGRRI